MLSEYDTRMSRRSELQVIEIYEKWDQERLRYQEFNAATLES
jgi:hypothetical protein